VNIRTRLARIKRRLFKKPFLKDPQHPPFWFDMAFGRKEAFLVQIGSNDGKTGDPFHELLHKNQSWSALFVEPVPYLFERLKKNYPGTDRFRFENAAINDGSNLTFYWVDPKVKNEIADLPFWYDQLGSFDKDHIVNELGESIRPFVLSEEKEGLTLKRLLAKQEVNKIDILHIDTEGHDWKILSQLDLDAFTPVFILFESNHLSQTDKKAAREFLKSRYLLFDAGIDTLAVCKDAIDSNLSRIKKHMKLLQPL
jgi:FkbM family methyltransferase